MAKKTDERKDIHKEDINTENKEIFKTWEDSYKDVSKMWDESCLNLYRSWSGSRGGLFEKAVELSKEATPKKYQEFYEEWVKTCQKTYENLLDINSVESSKETFEKILASAEHSNKISRSWIEDIEENSRITRDMLNGEPDPAKYNEVYDMWIRSYGKILDEFLTLPFREHIKETFEKLTGATDIYSNTLEHLLKTWNDSYMKVYMPWINSMMKLSVKSSEISRGNAGPEAYKEFYALWQNIYQETYGKLFDIQSLQPSKEAFEYFVRKASVDMKLSRSWINILEKMSQKTRELSLQNADPETYKEYYNLWAKIYEKAFENFFENIPTISPFKEIFEPVKNSAKIYSGTFTSISNNWMKSYPISASAV